MQRSNTTCGNAGDDRRVVHRVPDLCVEVETIHHADAAVVGEARMTGTHWCPFAGIQATGRSVEYPVVAVLAFEHDRLVSERVYFDSATASSVCFQDRSRMQEHET
jgi:predicted ester cyclase